MDSSKTIVDTKLEIRGALAGDAYAIATLYNDILRSSDAIYSEQPVSPAYMDAWLLRQGAQNHPVLVAYIAGRFAGYAAYGVFRSQSGFRHTVEHSVHIVKNERGQGVGRQLMMALIARGAEQGHHMMVGAVDGNNADSLAFHDALGFERAATLPQVGRGGDKWLDVVFVYRRLGSSKAGH